MGLPVRQRRVLLRIEGAIRGSDPKLAALYAIFARLNREEDMPRREQLRHSALGVLARLRRFPAAVFGRLHLGRMVPRQRAVLFLPVALLLAVASIVYAAKSSSGDVCTPVKQVASAHVTAKSKLCRPPATMLSPMWVGR
jgi:hypothetical protein